MGDFVVSMHLVRGVYDNGSNKKSKKPSKAQLLKWQKLHKEYNSHMARLGLPKLTFEQFVDVLHGKIKKVPVRTQIRQSKTSSGSIDNTHSISKHREKYPSLYSAEGTAAKKEENVYTGNKLLGIAAMHKSNLVPVFSREDAEELAKMRR
jgi:hypothetical protein